MLTKSQANSGFSLLELSISLVIIGLVTASFLGFMKISQQRAVMTNSQNAIKQGNEAIEIYLESNRQLPCPAPMLTSREDPRNGHALDCKAMLRGTNFTDKEYIITQSPVDKTQRIVIGRLPYNDLNIPYKDTLDGWNRDLFYAVTLDLTQETEYSQYGGVISIVDQFDKEITKSEHKAQYVLWSAAANNTGTLAGNCVKNTGPEQENCDEDGTFRSMLLSNGTVYYDDILSYAVFVKKPRIVDENCDLIEHLTASIPNIFSIINSYELNAELFYIRPGEMVTVCNRQILKELNEKQCITFVCRSDNTIGSVEIIR